jgi:alkyl hydroperoxide reductase subunit F
MGHEFTSLVLACCRPAAIRPRSSAEVIEQIKACPATFNFETFISLSCHNCPDVVQALNLMAVLNPGISHTMIDGALFQDEVERTPDHGRADRLPERREFGQGRMTLEEIVAKLDTGAPRAMPKSSRQGGFRRARRRRRPGRRRGGDLRGAQGHPHRRRGRAFRRPGAGHAGIENFISVKETDGPKLVAGLEQHVKDYDVDIMNLQRAEGCARHPGGLIGQAGQRRRR